jgi:type 1 glutamine amidotransferase
MEFHRRHFLQRAANAAAAAASVAISAPPARTFGSSKRNKTLRVCLLSGSEEYKSNESLASFQNYLEKETPVRCSRAFWKSKNDLPGLEALDTCDLMVLFTRRLELPNEQLDRVKKYCLAGRPIVGLRTASHAFQNWLELDREVFGGSYAGHYGSGLMTKIEVANGASKHPILSGFHPYESAASLYKNPRNADDTQLLLTGSIPEHTEPLAWTRERKGGRVFYTSLGGPDDFQRDEFRKLLTNAIFWAANRKRSA